MKTFSTLLLAAVAAVSLMTTNSSSAATSGGPTETAVFASGCFWCTEAVFEHVPGVKKVTSGYTGGHVANPTYKQVCEGDTGHAEATRIEFDPTVVSYAHLLEIFFESHDPTTLNRQGADEGTQYRSAIFYANDAQKAAAEAGKKAAQKNWDDPIVTEIAPLGKFYEAEDYHQDYFKNNPHAGYCSFVIKPKVKKLQSKGVISSERTVP
ncbi:peptide-methionine (S)-S-oxide reductase MsrA [Oleiharenicola sp. Vm1]|uniref:peptide-methionine (S)-S-oxide reductase MsrA n=1 Tax=Oleiharenicola sp. Vm1 TaxID=3398393 RepID=UPI0039F56DFC